MPLAVTGALLLPAGRLHPHREAGSAIGHGWPQGGSPAPVKGASHERDRRYVTGVKPKHRPVPLDEHKVLRTHDPVVVEEDRTLLEAGREKIALDACWYVVARPPSSIAGERTLRVVDGDTYPTAQRCFGAIAEPKGRGDFIGDSAMGNIRMARIEF